mgnify:CR=1 FL=1
MRNITTLEGDWQFNHKSHIVTYTCGYCGHGVASEEGCNAQRQIAESYLEEYETVASIRICPYCNCPTFIIYDFVQIPGELPGHPVTSIPTEIDAVYEEARRSIASEAYTGAVLLFRKILMHMAVERGAPANASFAEYVDYLVQTGDVPSSAKSWVDFIRKRGNDATHKITVMEKQDALVLLNFVEMLLRILYEYPAKV